MLELEKKVLLTQEEYRFLRDNACRDSVCTTQVNYYYDTENLFFNARGITCRIRKKGHELIATVKSHRPGPKGASLEHSFPADKVWDTFPLGPLCLKKMGQLTTMRTVCTPEPGVRIELDQNTYLDTADYELEIEYAPDREPAADVELNKMALALFRRGILSNPADFIQRTGKGTSKSQRFFSTKAAIKNSRERMGL